MKPIRCVTVDDEPLARELLRNYLTKISDIELIAECANGFEALKSIQELDPDLVFLDIQMPKIDGFELLEVLDYKPHIIFITAFDQYAIRAFEMNAVDYLLKPFAKERLIQAIDKARQRINSKTTDQPNAMEDLKKHLDNQEKEIDRVVVRQGAKIIIIPVAKIFYLEAQDDYVMIYSELGRHLKEKTMKYFESALPKNSFIRVHRSHLISLSHIASVELYEKNTHLVVMKNGDKLRASQDGYKRLRELF